MDTFIKLLEVLAKLSWPGIVIGVILMFRPAVASIIESARSRKFTLKVGGQELTMEEVNEQQSGLIADLQNQLVEIRKRLEKSSIDVVHKSTLVDKNAAPSPARILWVDDYPKNNSYFVEQLTKLGVKVDLALTTSEGVSMFARRKYRMIISDMGRREDGVERNKAGIELLKEIRTKNSTIPFVIYCSNRGVHQHGMEAKQLGVTGITSSPTELSGFLNLDELEAES
jgi:CheY-like chemotaxis protein